MNNFAKEIKERRPHCCGTDYHIRHIAFVINEPVSVLTAIYEGEEQVTPKLDAKLCAEFNRPIGYFMGGIGQISMF